MKHRRLPEHSALGSILRKGIEADVTTLVSHEAPIDEQNEHAMIRVVKCLTISAESEPPVVVIPSQCGLMAIERIGTAKAAQWILPRQGVHAVLTNVPF